jgi:hypothetical protein
MQRPARVRRDPPLPYPFMDRSRKLPARLAREFRAKKIDQGADERPLPAARLAASYREWRPHAEL